MTAAGNRPENGSDRLSPQQVRSAAFALVPRLRGGLHPDEVYAFLNQVAEEMTHLRQELAATTDDANRVKAALHRWQVEHAATCAQPPPAHRPPPPPTQPPWPGYGSQPHPG
jgi:DivIVA domain-containing protein